MKRRKKTKNYLSDFIFFFQNLHTQQFGSAVYDWISWRQTQKIRTGEDVVVDFMIDAFNKDPIATTRL